MRVPRPHSEWHAHHPAPTLSAFKRAGTQLWSTTGLQLRVPRDTDAGTAVLGDTSHTLWWILDAREKRREACVPDTGDALRLMSRAATVATVRVLSVWCRPSGASGYLVYDGGGHGMVAFRNRVTKSTIKLHGLGPARDAWDSMR